MKKQVTKQPVPRGLRPALKRLGLAENMDRSVSYALAMAVDADDFELMVGNSHGSFAAVIIRALYADFNPHGKGASRWPAPARPGAALTVRGYAAAYRDAGLPAPSATSARYGAAATTIGSLCEELSDAFVDCLHATPAQAANADAAAALIAEALRLLRIR